MSPMTIVGCMRAWYQGAARGRGMARAPRCSETRHQRDAIKRGSFVGLTRIGPGETIEIAQHEAGLLGGEVFTPRGQRVTVLRAEFIRDRGIEERGGVDQRVGPLIHRA